MSALCTWCGTAYEPRCNGGSVQRFCSKDCRESFNTACRVWAAAEYEAERLSIFTLRSCLGQHTRCVQRDSAPGGTGKALETGTRTDGPLTGSEEVAR